MYIGAFRSNVSSLCVCVWLKESEGRMLSEQTAVGDQSSEEISSLVVKW